ncbi:tetratricopeptide repeat protein [Spongiivirga sp. MCCC 1A20706]|uniref:tetratricopeptide repeat protein n=1 Tax=Spongiivirga sp. MCCC 1A20706 TaxID=3160963 RepID=UPI003977B5F9
MKYRCLFILFLTTNILFGQDQKKLDSMLTIVKTTKVDSTKAATLLEVAKLYRHNDPDQFLAYLKKSLEISEKTKDYLNQGNAYSYITAYYNIKGKLDSARYSVNESIKYYALAKDTLRIMKQKINVAYFDYYSGKREKAIKLLDSIEPVFMKYKDEANLANVYTIKYLYYEAMGYDNIALELIQKALKIYKKVEDKARIAQSLTMIAKIYKEQKKYHEALESYKESLEVCKETNNKTLEAQTQKFMGDIYTSLQDFDKARDHLMESLKLSKELNFTFNTANTISLLGVLEAKQENYDEAISFYNESLAIAKSMNNTDQLAVNHRNLGVAYNKQKKYKKALYHLDKAITISKNSKSFDLLIGSYHEKSYSQENLGDYKQALSSLHDNVKLYDSIFTVKNQQKVEELTIIYETEKKEQQITQQQTEISLLEEQKKVDSLQKTMLGGGLALSILLIGFGIYGFHERIRRNKIEKEKIESDLEFKTKELTTHALHLAKKNEVLNDLKEKAKVLKADADADPGYQMLIQTINFDLQDDNNWENFSKYFEEVHKDFNANAQEKYPSITSNDLRLMALLKMNLSSKEIANILNISSDGIKKARQRLRKKMGIDSNESLEAVVIAI